MGGKRKKRHDEAGIVAALEEIVAHGWYKMGSTESHAGRAGIFLEHLLGASDTNAPEPDVGIWELKTRIRDTHSLLTLFQLEPSPRRPSMARYLVEKFGWNDIKRKAGAKGDWLNFRQTLSCGCYTARGFSLAMHRGKTTSNGDRLVLLFNPEAIAPLFASWREELLTRGSPLDMAHQPYWLLKDIFHKASSKLAHCIYVTANIKTVGSRHYVRYEGFTVFSGLCLDVLPDLLKSRELVVYFNARSGHNHGTQFRIKPKSLVKLYEHVNVYGGTEQRLRG